MVTELGAIEQDDIIAAIKELHLENDQLRVQLDNVIIALRELQNEHIKLKGLVKILFNKSNISGDTCY